MPYDATPHTYTNPNNFNNTNRQPYSNVHDYRQNNPSTVPSYPNNSNYPTTLPSYPSGPNRPNNPGQGYPNYPNRPGYPAYPNRPNNPNWNVNYINYYPGNNNVYVNGSGWTAMNWANQWYPGWTAVSYRWYDGYWIVYIRSGNVYRTVYVAPDYSWHHFRDGYLY